MTITRPTLKSTTVTFLLAVYFYCALNITLNEKIYHILSSGDGYSLVFMISIPLFCIACLTILFNFFTIKYITKPFFALLLITGAMVNYSAYKYGIIFDRDMITNIVTTTPTEASSYSNVSAFLWLALSGFLPAGLLLWTRIQYRKIHWEIVAKLVVFITCTVVIGLIAAVCYKEYATVIRNNKKITKDIVPTYYVGSTYKYVRDKYFTTPLPYQEIGLDAKREEIEKDEKYLVVFVVGETARAANYQLNGYGRPTNPYTSQIDNMLYFKNTTSCGTATAVSLPCMFSFMDRKDYSLKKFESQDNVVDVLKRGGTRSIWVDNNTGCKDVCENIETFGSNEVVPLDCNGEFCTDDIFIDVLDKKLKELNGQEAILFLHLIGSHGPTYAQRYPKEWEKFKPACQTSDLQKCSDEEIRNAYDNTILFTDHVIAELIQKLKQYDDTYQLALVYMSDHGESLGENGLYLHGTPYAFAPDEQTHIPFQLWMSDDMISHDKIDMNCLKAKAEKGGFSHDNLAPTLLHLMDIDTEAYNPKQDVLLGCEG